MNYITLNELLSFNLLIVAIITLVISIIKKK